MNPKAIQAVQHCTTMPEVRRCVDALDDELVPLLVQRAGYMTQAARIKQDVNHVRDEARIQAIVDRVRAHAVAEGGEPAQRLPHRRARDVELLRELLLPEDGPGRELARDDRLLDHERDVVCLGGVESHSR